MIQHAAPRPAPTITLVGAGGMSFGPTMVNDIIHMPELAGARLVLHDVDERRLQRAYQFAAKLNVASGAPVVLDRTTEADRALDGADVVLSAAEHGRFLYRRQDYEVPNRYGAQQINGENGGPGAVFHTLRSVHNTLGICADIERHCPDAFLVNLSNPLSRVALAINRHTKVRNVSMCHEMPNGIWRLSKFLRMDAKDIEGKASGINHFTFFTELTDRRTGEDLLPRVRSLFAKRIFDYPDWTVQLARRVQGLGPVAALADELYMPLVVHMVREYGMVPCSIDSHIGEYLPFTAEVADWYPARVDVMEGTTAFGERLATWIARTKAPVPFLHRIGHSSEEVIPLITAMWTDQPRHLMAVNVPNDGYLPDVADGAIVEVGATVDGDGLHPDVMPPLGEPLAGWTATQVALQDLLVEAAVTGDRDLALRALLEDPLSPADDASCRAMFDELCELQADVLPF
jgi:alpha-galactosidase